MNSLISSGLLAAGMLLGQTGEPPTTRKTVIVLAPVAGQQGPQQQQQQPARPVLNWFSREDRPVLSKIQSWWNRDQPDMQRNAPNHFPGKGGVIRETPPFSNTAPPSNDFPRKLPQPQSKGTSSHETIVVKDTLPAKTNIQQTSLQQVAVPKSGKSPILPQLANKIGRDEKFAWITGQFENENGNFVLYYASPETIDKYQGRIVLLPQQANLAEFRKGDLVSVRGQLSQRQTPQGIVPIYRVNLASLMERPKS